MKKLKILIELDVVGEGKVLELLANGGQESGDGQNVTIAGGLWSGDGWYEIREFKVLGEKKDEKAT